MKKVWQKAKKFMEKEVSMEAAIIICSIIFFAFGFFIGIIFPTSTKEETFTNVTADDEAITFTDGIITATLDKESGTLTFSGRGAVDGFKNSGLEDLTPKQRASVRAIVFKDGITSIGNCEFSDRQHFINLEKVVFEGDINTIGNFAFSENPNLTTVQFNGSCRQIGYLAFYRCAALVSVNIPDGCRLSHDVFSWTPLDEDWPWT